MMMGARFVNICLLTKQAVNLARRTPTVKIGLLQHDLTARGINFSAKSVDVLMLLRTAGQKKEEQQSNSDKKD